MKSKKVSFVQSERRSPYAGSAVRPNIDHPYFGSKWLITGGTSGLGRALAIELATGGAEVAAVARGRAGLERLAREFPSRGGNGAIYPIEGDISRKGDIHSIAAQAFARLGRVDFLLNNASSLGSTSLRWLSDTDCEDVEAALAANVLGPFRLTKLILPSMLLSGQGTVVNISSDAAVNAYPTWGAYGASKAALDHMTRVWSAELADFRDGAGTAVEVEAESEAWPRVIRGLRIVAVDPGDMDTPLHEQAVPGADRSQLKTPETAARQLLAWLPDARSGERRSL